MSSSNDSSSAPNPWRTGVIIAVTAVVVFLATGAVVAYFDDDDTLAGLDPSATPTAADAPDVASAPPPAAAVEDCNRLATEARRDTGEIAKNGLIGGALGAGVGAAGGAIAKGGKGAGKGAGIGALVGAVGGTLYGLNEENQRSEEAARAYRECMDRRGY
ncbi:MAG TPA: hypothetical protein VKB65_09125 [Myxococcota bacterium]|nr:hypothetical protein [Myxococcota bacterium]